MPKIPTFTREITPVSTRTATEPAPLRSPQAVANERNSGIFQLANTVEGIANHQIRLRERDQLLAQRNQIQEASQTIDEQLAQAAESARELPAKEAVEFFNKESERISRDIVGGFDDAEVKRQVGLHYRNEFLKKGVQFSQKLRQAQVDRQLAGLKESQIKRVDEYVREASPNTRALIQAQFQDELDSAVRAGIITQSAAVGLVRETFSKADENILKEKVVTSDLSGVQSVFNDLQDRGYLDEFYPNLDESARISLLSSASYQITQKQKEAIELAQKEAAFRVIGQSDSGELGPLDPYNRDEVKTYNEWFEQRKLPSLEGMDPEDRRVAIVESILNTGVMPDVIKRRVSGGVLSEDPEVAYDSALLLTDSIQANPQITKQFDRRQIALAQMITSLSDSLGKEAAVASARKAILEPRGDEVEKRRSSFSDKKFLGQANEEFKKLVKDLQPGGWPAWLGGAPDDENAIYNEELKSDFMEYFKQQFLLGQDSQTAFKSAKDFIKSDWKYMDGEIQKYGPNLLDPVSSTDSPAQKSWAVEQFEVEAQAAGLDPVGKSLQIDPRSTDTERPQYIVMQTDENGVPEPVLNERNEPVVFVPDYKTSPRRTEALKQEVRLRIFEKAERETHDILNQIDPETRQPIYSDEEKVAQYGAILKARVEANKNLVDKEGDIKTILDQAGDKISDAGSEVMDLVGGAYQFGSEAASSAINSVKAFLFGKFEEAQKLRDEKIKNLKSKYVTEGEI